MNPTAELIALLGGLVGSLFALVRYTLGMARTTADRFAAYLERKLEQEVQAHEQLRRALEGVGECVRENSRMLQRLVERLKA